MQAFLLPAVSSVSIPADLAVTLGHAFPALKVLTRSRTIGSFLLMRRIISAIV